MTNNFSHLNFLERVNMAAAIKARIKSLGDNVHYDYGGMKENVRVCAELYARLNHFTPHSNPRLIKAKMRYSPGDVETYDPHLSFREWEKLRK